MPRFSIDTMLNLWEVKHRAGKCDHLFRDGTRGVTRDFTCRYQTSGKKITILPTLRSSKPTAQATPRVTKNAQQTFHEAIHVNKRCVQIITPRLFNEQYFSTHGYRLF